MQVSYFSGPAYLYELKLARLEEANNDCDSHQGVDDGVVDVDDEDGDQMELLLVH